LHLSFHLVSGLHDQVAQYDVAELRDVVEFRVEVGLHAVVWTGELDGWDVTGELDGFYQMD